MNCVAAARNLTHPGQLSRDFSKTVEMTIVLAHESAGEDEMAWPVSGLAPWEKLKDPSIWMNRLLEGAQVSWLAALDLGGASYCGSLPVRLFGKGSLSITRPSN